MTTKEQERKALEQIKKIIAGLGEDSYIGTAFEGCFEIAEQNIEDDFAFSMKQRWEKAEKDSEYFHEIANHEAAEIKRLEQEVQELKEDCKALNDRIHNLIGEKNMAQQEMMNERKDVTVETTDGNRDCTSFARVQFYNNDGFKFINVVQKSGWTTSYKIDDLKTLVIE